MRGEDGCTVPLTRPNVETPPRAWGRRQSASAFSEPARNTPTCVGKTALELAKSHGSEKHPHVRGEDVYVLGPGWRIAETPPRAWGRQTFFTPKGVHWGNTPTCVGKTGPRLLKTAAIGKHPHVRGEDPQWPRPRRPLWETRGEDIAHLGWQAAGLETPPRAWGRPRQRVAHGLSSGNTPTCVGKTLNVDEIQNESEKHPHVRGEDAVVLQKPFNFVETPPRAWGRQAVNRGERAFIGNTPTCVGKTRYLLSVPQLGWKHPHVRGEDSQMRRLAAIDLETPPRAWGRPNRYQVQETARGNTPTCVGKTGFMGRRGRR